MEARGDVPPPATVSDRTGTGDLRRWRALALLGTAFFMVILDVARLPYASASR